MTANSPGPRMVAEVLAAATHRLQQAGVPDPRLDAELLLGELLETDRADLVLRRKEPVPPDLHGYYEEWVRRRARREPLQHILGAQEFYGLRIRVDGRVLVPRPETELLVEAVLEAELPQGSAVADLGTGSACIPVALATHRPDLRLHGLDRSAAALEVALENVAMHGLQERIELRQANLSSPPAAWRGAMDAVVSNPPYIAAEEWRRLEPEVRDWDPQEALIAGPTGLEAYSVLVPVSAELLRPGGLLALELGFSQVDRVRDLVRVSGFDVVEVRDDLRQIPRVLLARKAP